LIALFINSLLVSREYFLERLIAVPNNGKKNIFCILFFFPNSLLAQMIISRPTFAFTQACANSGFNLFDVQ
jgi:hypothetical protein